MRENLIFLTPPVVLGLIFGLLSDSGLMTGLGIAVGWPMGLTYLWWKERHGR